MLFPQPVHFFLSYQKSLISIFAATNSPPLLHSLHISGGRKWGMVLTWLRTKLQFYSTWQTPGLWPRGPSISYFKFFLRDMNPKKSLLRWWGTDGNLLWLLQCWHGTHRPYLIRVTELLPCVIKGPQSDFCGYSHRICLQEWLSSLWGRGFSLCIIIILT